MIKSVRPYLTRRCGMRATCREGFCCWMLVAALLVLIVADQPAGLRLVRRFSQ